MYVRSLDRPWVESPFLFQGFVIEDDETLQQLRSLCEYVFVDVEQSRVDVPERQDVDHSVSPVASSIQVTEFRSYQEFRSAARKAGASRMLAGDYLERVFSDVRMGKSMGTADAKNVVSDMVDTISASPNTALWLTNLRQHSEHTAVHCLNVCVLVLAFCKHLGYSREEMEVIGLGALLLDIGKTRTPDHILNKPGRLTREEFAIMKRHPEDGYRLMVETGDVPPQALGIIRLHHERLAGHGYPLGLSGESITRPILMTAIADVYDAVTSDRVYQLGMPPDVALQAMYEKAETNYGRDLMQEFIKCMGIYPVGSLVQLENGATGIVLSAGEHTRLAPRVLLIKDTRGRFYKDRRLVDLARLQTQDRTGRWIIRRVVNPAEAGVDVTSVMLDETSLPPVDQVDKDPAMRG